MSVSQEQCAKPWLHGQPPITVEREGAISGIAGLALQPKTLLELKQDGEGRWEMITTPM
jgi:hypothetical protein